MADGFLSVDPDPAWKQMKRLAKPLFSSLGELRDTQVMMEWVAKLSHPGDPVGESLSAALAQKETALKVAAQEALASFDRKHWASLNAHLAKRTGRIPLEGLVFQHLALERWMEAHQLHRRALRNRSGVGYHQLRIGIKRFRYTVENFLPQRHARWAKDLRELQDSLGEVHDLDVLRAMIRAHADIPADERLRWQKANLGGTAEAFGSLSPQDDRETRALAGVAFRAAQRAGAGRGGDGKAARAGLRFWILTWHTRPASPNSHYSCTTDFHIAGFCPRALNIAAFWKLLRSCMRWEEARCRRDTTARARNADIAWSPDWSLR